MGIVWIASYPKSGNTLVRFLLASYFVGPIESSRDVARCVPHLNPDGSFSSQDPWRTPARGHLLVKTHFVFSPAHPRVQETAGYIHIIRNPKDVLLSALNYRRLEQLERPGSIGEFSDEEYARAFIASGGDALWRQLGYGTWEEHAASWHLDPGVPHVRARYRDLRSGSAPLLRAMLAMLGEPVDEARVELAVRDSSFENMRALEIREKHAGESTGVFTGGKGAMRKGRFFMNKGQMGQTLGHLARGIDEAFDRRFGASMQRLGVSFGSGAAAWLTEFGSPIV